MAEARPLRLLFAENQDSFSWNVVDALPFDRAEVRVRPGRALADDPGALAGSDVVVIGPGPTDPERAGLVGLVREAARRRLPLLGICLGHQAVGVAFGARVVPVPPVHGRCCTVTFAKSRLFPGVCGRRVVMRYNSLALAGVVPPLRVIARDRDGVPMAIEHESLPVAGLQFHPDSYATPGGREMLAAFFRAVR